MGFGSPESTTNALSGGVAGAANIFTGFPFDTVKVRLQASPRGTYAGPIDCTRSILKFEGVRGLYRGLAAPLVGGALETGISYAVYTYTLGQLTAPGELPSLSYAVPAAAGVAGVVLSFVLSPFELVKCRLQMGTRGSLHYHSGPRQCLQHLLKTEGSLGLTRGLKATIVREAPGNAIFFTVYEDSLLWDRSFPSDDMTLLQTLRRSFPGRTAPDNPNPSLWELAKDSASAVGCGGLAGTVMWSAVLPLDVAKTRIQTAYPHFDVLCLMFDMLLTCITSQVWARYMTSAYGRICSLCTGKSKTGTDLCKRHTWNAGGRRTLYAGLVPTLIRAFPANAAQWLAWELSRRQIQSAMSP